MPVTADKPAPYTTSSSIIDLIERHRSRGLPSPVTADVLARAGISDSLVPRTLQALQTLDLIDELGMPTGTLEGLRLAPEADYQQRLSEWLKNAYADVLGFVDPAEDGETEIRDAFRSYQPVGQQSRMVTLFLGLLSAAGMIDEKYKGQSRRSVTTPVTKSSAGAKKSSEQKRRSSPSPLFPPSASPPPPMMSEKALEYRLVDLMSEAVGDEETMQAIIKVITFLKTKNVSDPAAPNDNAGREESS